MTSQMESWTLHYSGERGETFYNLDSNDGTDEMDS